MHTQLPKSSVLKPQENPDAAVSTCNPSPPIMRWDVEYKKKPTHRPASWTPSTAAETRDPTLTSRREKTPRSSDLSTHHTPHGMCAHAQICTHYIYRHKKINEYLPRPVSEQCIGHVFSHASGSNTKSECPLVTEVSVPLGPKAIQYQRNKQRPTLIINCLAY